MSVGARPLFLFSLPRSGSTMVQTLLVTDPRVKSCSEPWILLPVFTIERPELAAACYAANDVQTALFDSKSKQVAYQEAAKAFYYSFIEGLVNESSQVNYFVDKTPRYLLISRQIKNAFGADASYLYLLRNPLDIVASIRSTWSPSKWNLVHWFVDLFGGMRELEIAVSEGSELVIKYESITENPNCFVDFLSEHFAIHIDANDRRFREARAAIKGAFGDEKVHHRPPTVDRTNRSGFVATSLVDWLFARIYVAWIKRRCPAIYQQYTEELTAPVKTVIGLQFIKQSLVDVIYGGAMMAILGVQLLVLRVVKKRPALFALYK